MNINLREEATSEYLSLYENFLDEIESLNKKIVDGFYEEMQKSKYDKFQRFIFGVMSTYADIIVNGETNIISIWLESPVNLHSYLKDYRAGEAAEEVCVQIEHQMEELTYSKLSIEEIEPIISDRPIVSEEGFSVIEGLCKTAQIEVQEIKNRFLSQISSKEVDNNIYKTLTPLIESTSNVINSFYEVTLNAFTKIHEYVINIINGTYDTNEDGNYDIGQDNADNILNTYAGSNSENLRLGNNPQDTFKDLTDSIYRTIEREYYCKLDGKEKTIPYDAVAELMHVYKSFYNKFGMYLKDNFNSPEERKNFINTEYINVTQERNNVKYFNSGDWEKFKAQVHDTYSVFEFAADMEKNIALDCIRGKANDNNFTYGAYVLFTPILKGYVETADNEQYEQFKEWAVDEIDKILQKKYDNHLDEKDVNESEETEETEEQDESEKTEESKESAETRELEKKDIKKIYVEIEELLKELDENIPKRYQDLYNSLKVLEKSSYIISPILKKLNRNAVELFKDGFTISNIHEMACKTFLTPILKPCGKSFNGVKEFCDKTLLAKFKDEFNPQGDLRIGELEYINIDGLFDEKGNLIISNEIISDKNKLILYQYKVEEWGFIKDWCDISPAFGEIRECVARIPREQVYINMPKEEAEKKVKYNREKRVEFESIFFTVTFIYNSRVKYSFLKFNKKNDSAFSNLIDDVIDVAIESKGILLNNVENIKHLLKRM